MKIVFWEKKIIVDGKILSEEIKQDANWCCSSLERSNYEIQHDKKFGVPNFDYDEWGEPVDYPTTEIKICPFCGDKIEVVELKPLVKRGKKEWDIKKIKGTMVIKKNPRYVWEDGSVDNFKDLSMMHTSKKTRFVPDREKDED